MGSGSNGAIAKIATGAASLGAFIGLLLEYGPTRGAPGNLMATLLFAGVGLSADGFYRFFAELPREHRIERTITSLALLAGFTGTVAVSLVSIYVRWWQRTGPVCHEARTAPTVEARVALLAKAHSWEEHLYGPLYNCRTGRSELDGLERGQCPHVVPTDRPCACGQERWPRPLDCAGAVLCEPEAGLHCADDG